MSGSALCRAIEIADCRITPAEKEENLLGICLEQPPSAIDQRHAGQQISAESAISVLRARSARGSRQRCVRRSSLGPVTPPGPQTSRSDSLPGAWF